MNEPLCHGHTPASHLRHAVTLARDLISDFCHHTPRSPPAQDVSDKITDEDQLLGAQQREQQPQQPEQAAQEQGEKEDDGKVRQTALRCSFICV